MKTKAPLEVKIAESFFLLLFGIILGIVVLEAPKSINRLTLLTSLIAIPTISTYGLIRRRRWSRKTCAAIILLWGLATVTFSLFDIFRGANAAPYATAIVWFIGLGAICLSYRLYTSERVKSYLSL